jgi:hypothetical protein
MKRPCAVGVTLIELVLVISLIGIAALILPRFVFEAVQGMVLIPNALSVNQAATEILQQLIEGGWSTLPGQAGQILGLRAATRLVPPGESTWSPALWLVEPERVGFMTSAGQAVLIRYDAATRTFQRSVLPLPVSCSAVPSGSPEEPLPSYASGRVLVTAPQLAYYTQSGQPVSPTCPPSPTIRRIEVAFSVQTGSGLIQEGHTRHDVVSSVAVRVP